MRCEGLEFECVACEGVVKCEGVMCECVRCDSVRYECEV